MFRIQLGFRLARAFLCAPVALTNILAEDFKHWKSPRFQDPTCNVPGRRAAAKLLTRDEGLTCNAFVR
jgi:hypothetical protein